MFIYNFIQMCKSMANSIAFTFESVFITKEVIFNWSWCYRTRQSKLTKSLHTTFLKTLNYCNKFLMILGRNNIFTYVLFTALSLKPLRKIPFYTTNSIKHIQPKLTLSIAKTVWKHSFFTTLILVFILKYKSFIFTSSL